MRGLVCFLLIERTFMKPFVGSGLYLVISYVWLQNLNTPSSCLRPFAHAEYLCEGLCHSLVLLAFNIPQDLRV